MVSKELLEIIACPKCKGPLTFNETKNSLRCQKCKLRYPITDGIPELLMEKAEPVQEE